MAFDSKFDKFVEPARPRSQIWRLILGVFLMIIVYVVVVIGLAAAMIPFLGFENLDWLISQDAFDDSWALLWLLSTFLGMFLAPIVTIKLLHRRSIGSLFGRSAVFLRDFVITAAVYLAIGSPLTIGWIIFGDVSPNLNWLVWLSFLPLTLLALGLQTLSEELVFRGYLLQQLGARFRSPFFWMVLPSLVFGALHYDPSAGGTAALGVVGITAVFGLVAADLTARTGSLGAAWGFHLANNFIALALISIEGTLTGLSLFKSAFSIADGLPFAVLIGDICLILFGWFVVRRILLR